MGREGCSSVGSDIWEKWWSVERLNLWRSDGVKKVFTFALLSRDLGPVYFCKTFLSNEPWIKRLGDRRGCQAFFQREMQSNLCIFCTYWIILTFEGVNVVSTKFMKSLFNLSIRAEKPIANI